MTDNRPETNGDLNALVNRLHALLDRAEALLPPASAPVDFRTDLACRWRRGPRSKGYLQPIAHPHRVQLDELHGIDRQKRRLCRNTLQFLERRPANNALLWGSRGTGKSSLVKALLTAYGDRGLRLVEVAKTDLPDLPDIVGELDGRAERFILFCDDLSFAAEESGYQTLKGLLEGSVDAPPENVLIYATSNRRHLMPEYLSENQQTRLIEGEIHHGDSVEEKISLSERFGLWLSFHPFDQDQYLTIVRHALTGLDAGVDFNSAARQAALAWALERGSRSGRVAWQFARDWTGQTNNTHAQD
ncbi:MAG: ATP-binding protein [Pseudomonadota bacterium]|nr:ATP-binding protein [Pseudomonadota bacterium]